MNKENLKKPLAYVGHLVVEEQDYSTEYDVCIMCNKKVKESKYYIHACEGSIDYICSQDDDDYVTHNDAGDMGSWTVGSECVKKLKTSLLQDGVNPDDYIFTKSNKKSKAKEKTKSWNITEEDTLVLWRALSYYANNSYKIPNAPESDYEKASLLLAKVIHKSCSFAGTLDEGETVKSIYEGMGF